jgi:hypothetical protein
MNACAKDSPNAKRKTLFIQKIRRLWTSHSRSLFARIRIVKESLKLSISTDIILLVKKNTKNTP